jgi:hypothetical protein
MQRLLRKKIILYTIGLILHNLSREKERRSIQESIDDLHRKLEYKRRLVKVLKIKI